MTPYREKKIALRDGCVIQGFAAPSLFKVGTGALSTVAIGPFEKAAAAAATARMNGRWNPEAWAAWRRVLARKGVKLDKP